jgi:DNA-binding MarR family transcriptional regulator
MTLTGLSSSAASLFIDKMTSLDVVIREQDPKDRRNILVRPSKDLLDLFEQIDFELERIIANELRNCTDEQIEALESSCLLVCRKLETINGLQVLP